MDALWEVTARETRISNGAVDVEGCNVRFRRAGKPESPPMILVHGGAAHGGWWAPVLADLARRFDVLVVDLSGYGDSEHRSDYGPGVWVNDLAAVIAACRLTRVTVVGHSMGGKVATFLAAQRPELVRRVVLVDSAVRPAPRAGAGTPRGRPRLPKRVYATKQEAVLRFRLRPPETTADPGLLRAVAGESVLEVAEGWTWKFDPEAGQRITDAALAAALTEVACPLGMAYGSRSTVVGAETIEYITERLGRRVPAVPIANAYHHVSLDSPEGCRAAVEEIIEML